MVHGRAAAFRYQQGLHGTTLLWLSHSLFTLLTLEKGCVHVIRLMRLEGCHLFFFCYGVFTAMANLLLQQQINI